MKFFNPLTHFLDILEIFRLDTGQSSSNLFKKAFATRQHAFLSTSISFYDIFAQACAEIKISRFWRRKWPMSLGFSLFFPFIFLLFLSFPSSGWPSSRLVFSSRISQKVSVRQNSYHRVAKCSWGKFCHKFFTQISKPFRAYFKLNSPNHSDLGITGKIFSSCRT